MLDLVWYAMFSDGKIIPQFDDVNTQTGEHRFQEVLDHDQPLVSFHLVNLKTKKMYRVDLKTGSFYFHSLSGPLFVPEDEAVGNPNNKYRLIHFRRVTQTIKQCVNGLSSELDNIQYMLGYQYTDESGKNHKRIVQISPNDEIKFS